MSFVSLSTRRVPAQAVAAIAAVAALAGVGVVATPARAATGLGLYATVQLAKPTAVAVDPSTHTVYVADDSGGDGDGTVDVIEGATGQHLHTSIAVGDDPSAIAVNPVNHRVYVANELDGTLSIIDGADLAAAPMTVPLGEDPSSVAVDPTTDIVWVGEANGSVAVLSGLTGAAVHAPVPLGPGDGGPVSALAVDPSRNTVYAGESAIGLLWTINGDDYQIKPSAGEGLIWPSALAIDPLTQVVYSVASYGQALTSISELTNATLGEAWLTPFIGPAGVAVDPSTDDIYLPNGLTGTVSVWPGPLPSAPSLSAHVAPGLVGIAVDPSTHDAYAISAQGTLTILVPRDTTVPGPPTAAVATAGHGLAGVRFDAPQSEGGSPITSYTVTAIDQTDPAGDESHAYPASDVVAGVGDLGIGELLAGDTYTLTVAAANAVGTGAASAPSNRVVVLPPVGKGGGLGCIGILCQ